MKKRVALAVCAVCLLLTALLTVPALAHGHHGGHGRGGAPLAVCPVEDCRLAETHQHDGVSYCGHTAGDGHAQCVAAGCENKAPAYGYGHHGKHCRAA